MHGTVAWTRQRWLPTEQARLSVDDVGFLQGVVVVDRLRTCQGVPLDVLPHINRMMENCLQLGIGLPAAHDIARNIEECVSRNRAAFAGRDFSIVTLATPGPIGRQPAEPTLIIHPAAIAWPRLAHWYTQGQPLYVSSHRNVPSLCWSPALKTRSRLQYYLADRQAAEWAADSPASVANAHYAGGVLLDLHEQLTETSQANVLIAEGERDLIVPPVGSILEGISLQRTLELAEMLGLQVRREPISVQRGQDAQELLLCGSTALFWPASRLGEREFVRPAEQPIYRRLRQAWCDTIGFDYCQQAREVATQMDD